MKQLKKKFKYHMMLSIVSIHTHRQSYNCFNRHFNNDLDELNTRTKLTATDIHKLKELCLSKSYFLYENKIRLLENAGPFGLSLTVVLSESYLQYLEHKVIAEALTIHIQPKTFKRYVDNSHAHFPSIHQAKTFQEILNKQDPAIQYTTEYENRNKSLYILGY